MDNSTRSIEVCCSGQSATQPTCSPRPPLRPENEYPHNTRSRCGKCHCTKLAPAEFTSGWCNDCRRQLAESLADTQAELSEAKAVLTKRAEAAERTVTFLRKLHISPLDPDFKGDINFFVVGSDHLSCRLCKLPLQGFDPPIQAHRLILSSKSPVFHQMLETKDWSDVWEAATGAIEIRGVTPILLRAALNFMYTAEITFDQEVLPIPILEFAHKFQIEELKHPCALELASNISENNLKEMMALANEFQAEALRIRCKNFFQERF